MKKTFVGPIELIGFWSRTENCTFLKPVKHEDLIRLFGENAPKTVVITPTYSWRSGLLVYYESNENHELPVFPPMPGEILPCYVRETDTRGIYEAILSAKTKLRKRK